MNSPFRRTPRPDSLWRAGRLAGAFAACLLWAVAGFADTFDNDFEETPWVEIEAVLPAFPEEANLIPFTVGAVEDKRFYVDEKSVSLASDGVIRYTLVIVSSAGARNITFEAMRCETLERRLYAFGRSDRTWSRAKKSSWQPIKGNSDNHYVELKSTYFCPAGQGVMGDARDVIRSLRHPYVRR